MWTADTAENSCSVFTSCQIRSKYFTIHIAILNITELLCCLQIDLIIFQDFAYYPILNQYNFVTY